MIYLLLENAKIIRLNCMFWFIINKKKNKLKISLTKGEKWFKIVWHRDEAARRNSFEYVDYSK